MVSVEVSFFYYFNFSIGSQSLFSLQRVSTQTPSQICTHTDTAANTFALNDGPHGTKMVEHIQRDHDRKKSTATNSGACDCVHDGFLHRQFLVWLVYFRCVIWLGFFNFIFVDLLRQSVRVRARSHYILSHSLLKSQSANFFFVRRGGGFTMLRRKLRTDQFGIKTWASSEHSEPYAASSRNGAILSSQRKITTASVCVCVRFVQAWPMPHLMCYFMEIAGKTQSRDADWLIDLLVLKS